MIAESWIRVLKTVDQWLRHGWTTVALAAADAVLTTQLTNEANNGVFNDALFTRHCRPGAES